jgi:NADH-quinone oxidoreductase subunit M
VLAALFLVVALATLAMPGSANFVGEFMILLGVFKARIAIALIASIGVVLASVYALRMYIRAMHNRRGAAVTSIDLRARDGLVLVPLVAAIVAFALYPQQELRHGQSAVRASLQRAIAAGSTTASSGQVTASSTGGTP